MFNNVQIIGRVGSQSELKVFDTGARKLELRVATNENFKNHDGMKAELTEWHSVTVWNDLAQKLSILDLKGQLVFIQGPLKSSSYEKEGQKKRIKFIRCDSLKFLEPKAKSHKNSDENKDLKNFNEEIPF